MTKVIGVRFQNAGKLYYFDPGENWPTPGDYVVVETNRGVEFGEVVTPVQELTECELESPFRQVMRIASADDIRRNEENHRKEKEAHGICQRKIAEHKLDMKLISVEYAFDGSKILFYFTSNGRVDFRSLVKDLAGIFKTRIELRQIGVRDEAKMLGGLGPCGRPVCCGTFLGDFQPVSIKMAKEQNLSLNPIKISGICGRLMCCLKYEEDDYEQTRKKMPKVGKEVGTPDGVGIVWDLNIIRETVRVRMQKGDSFELKDYPLEQVTRVDRNAAVPARSEAPAADSSAVQDKAVEIPAAPADEAAEKPAAEASETVQENIPDAKPAAEPVMADSPKAPEAPKPAVSPWKLAVAQALKAAKGEKPEVPAAAADSNEQTAADTNDMQPAAETAPEQPAVPEVAAQIVAETITEVTVTETTAEQTVTATVTETESVAAVILPAGDAQAAEAPSAAEDAPVANN